MTFLQESRFHSQILSTLITHDTISPKKQVFGQTFTFQPQTFPLCSGWLHQRSHAARRSRPSTFNLQLICNK